MTANLLDGKELCAEMLQRTKERVEGFSQRGRCPTLAVVRIGACPADVAYERMIEKMAEKVGITLKSIVIDDSAPESAVIDALNTLNTDSSVDGTLLFRPLPSTINEKQICREMIPFKDVDGISEAMMSMVYEGGILSPKGAPDVRQIGFAPCTAEAVIRVLKYNKIDLVGKHVVVVGRSVVIGKPVAMLLLDENATVTICHTKTQNLDTRMKSADVVVVAAGISGGRASRFGAKYFSPGQTVIDVGIHEDEEGMYGDVDTDVVSEIVSAITPVPGGLGSVTVATLLTHVMDASETQA
ncbi:MAG: bifunctional 5,10-methylenetetrahydrofolate dehydrogenase/5,10-methenyltetrahydrofolate cyclohydrolase [Clostridiales Family XIII bacterium]|jgi:methylenetetrahydrofolate dehydrogenase (NADP+)/methenyltetrahydrofolate cyclohydrolase|nr:bifunctional 5,10-methylenetetrahydrofolate dehydrogenase/5,10-methenyltetrahydrofolate cyclohydrolase [Clostridiales Family XIII bacterium]